uniref:Uncharacterized protein n=1 Tax=viral metagenome TaxID=1070528 RepID=A0A6M3LT94_9ZZZZ
MEIIKWANNKGMTIKLTDNEAKKISRKLEDPDITKITFEELEIEIEG